MNQHEQHSIARHHATHSKHEGAVQFSSRPESLFGVPFTFGFVESE